MRWWPWVAASLAIHGLLLSVFPANHAPGSDGQVETVKLVWLENEAHPVFARPKQTSVPARIKAAGDRIPVSKARRVPPAAMTKQEPVVKKAVTASGQDQQVQGSTSSSSRSAASSDADERSLIRRHLEQFKYYPAAARRRGIEGVVEVFFALGLGGHATELAITNGSGHPILDRAALQTVRRAEPFPAEAGRYRFRLVFRRS